MPLPITPTKAPTIQPPTPIVSPTPIIPPLATSTPPAETWEDYAGPTIYSGMSVPPPMGILEQPDNQVNILLLGSDQRRSTGSFRTDVVLLITLNSELGSINVTSFPRDLYVYIPGWSMERINTAHFRGGFELTALTFEYNFGVRPDHYLMVNFEGFRKIINELGGVDVQVAKSLSDYRTDYGYYTIEPGVVHMDGSLALWYVRSRKTTNDFDRTRRQQEVLQAIFHRLLSADTILNAPKYYDQFDDLVITDMTFQDLLPFLPLATKLTEDENVHSYSVNSTHVTSWITYGGAQVLLPIRNEIKILMTEVLNIE
jgi:LCP family protein required for cell wall assembly